MITIELSDYIQFPCDDACDAIRRALAYAKQICDGDKHEPCELHIGRGIYNLKTPVNYQTDQSAHDAGAVMTGFKEVLILAEGLSDFSIRGDVGEDGEPATILVGINTLEPNSIQPVILWCEGCDRLTVKNLKFTRAPEFASAGRVESVDGDRITVRVTDGNPCYDGMGTYCMNRFTPDGKTLNGESLSYGPGLGKTFRLIGNRLLELVYDKIANRVEVGDLLSWHQGAKTDFQCYFGRMRDLTLSNLRTTNSNGFAMIAFDVYNITADRVVFKPEGNQLFTAPRDAWKLHKCSGRIEISNFYVEGVRMDGQNVHNNYLFIKERVSDTELIVVSENARTDFLGSDGRGCEIEFFKNERYIGKLPLLDSRHLSTSTENGKNLQTYKFRFDNTLPAEVEVSKSGKYTGTETLALANRFSPEFYHCADSEFRNVAGAGHLLRCSHVLIERCRYSNTMNAGIMLGAEFPTHHEGGSCSDVLIVGCEFDNCGFAARYGTVGCVGINSAGFETAVNSDIEIANCRFSNSSIGVDIHKAKQVKISGCSYNNIGAEVVLN